VCLQQSPVVFAIDRAGISGPDGCTHHGIFDISFLNAMPNMIIAQPRNGQVLVELLESSFSWKKPASIRYPNMETEDVTLPLKERKPGSAEVLSSGSELLIISLGHMAQMALEVKEELKKQGVNATVLDPVFIKPLDTELLYKLLLTHDKIVTLEEHAVSCGLGNIVNNFLLTSGFNHVNTLNIGIADLFPSHGSYKDLMNELGLTTPSVTKKITDSFNFKSLTLASI
jgi:1-deoxy-D-xylulose-5-phosphate synthase